MATSIYVKLRAGVVTTSAAETQALGTELALALPDDATLALHGDLGAGKTTFVQGLARGFGITEAVTSPTFNLYGIHRGSRQLLVHLDAYRIKMPRELDDLLLEDFLVSPWCLAIEWPEKVAGWIPPRVWHLHFGISGEHRHTLKLRD